MAKIALCISMMIYCLQAEILHDVNRDILQRHCLTCHQEQKIPSNLIYKRYLLKYSTQARIKAAIFSYLKHPEQQHSIMPSAFFLKFPMKAALSLDDATLKRAIKAYVAKFSLQKRLRLKKQ